ncbi:MAG: YchJ family protein [Polyangiales bacterium]
MSASGKGCRCGSNVAYAECCRPFHRGEREAPTAEALMRSRYSAFALGEVEYLWRTLATSNPDRDHPRDALIAALRHTCSRLKFMGLRVHESEEARVLYQARVFEKGRDVSFLELAEFEREGDGWRYAVGKVKGAVGRALDDAATIRDFEAGGDEH